MEKKKILVLSTGGTVEKTYEERDGSLTNRESLIRARLLTQLRLPYTELEIKELMAKDSLDMTQADRDLVAKEINDRLSEKNPVVILHGTDTMTETAKTCLEKVKPLSIPIIFTGAMKPAGFMDTDAIQNFTEALMAARLAEPGVYISFHGCLHRAPNVRKDHERGTFVSKPK